MNFIVSMLSTTSASQESLRLAELEDAEGLTSFRCSIDRLAFRVGDSLVPWDGQTDILEDAVVLCDGLDLYSVKIAVSLLGVDSTNNTAITLHANRYLLKRKEDGSYYEDNNCGCEERYIGLLKSIRDFPNFSTEYTMGKIWGRINYVPKNPSFFVKSSYGNFTTPVSPRVLNDMNILRTAATFKRIINGTLDLLNSR